MRTEQLEYIAAITQLGSFRRAAEELHISQPALSESVRNLERELGVDILDRTRSGARVSERGAELLPYIISVLEAVDQMRRVADDQHRAARNVRLGIVDGAATPLLTPTIRAFREAHPQTGIEVIALRQGDLHRSLREGALDLGLAGCLDGDDLPPDLETCELAHGRAVVCMAPDSSLAQLRAICVEDLLAVPLLLMRAGDVMHRYVHRLLPEGVHPPSCSMDSAEMGKSMVAEGLGAAVLADFSVIGHPLERAGMLTYRPLREEGPTIRLMLQRRRSGSTPGAAHALREMLVESARAAAAAPGPPDSPLTS